MHYKINRGEVTKINAGLNISEFIETYQILSIITVIVAFIVSMAIIQDIHNLPAELFNVAVFVIIIFGCRIFYNKKGKSQIEMRRNEYLRINDEEVEYNESTQVMLMRTPLLGRNFGVNKYSINQSGLDNEPYQATDQVLNEWKVAIRNEDKIQDILKMRVSLRGTNYYAPIFNNIAETIAKELNLSLVDSTGKNEVVIPPKEMDVPLMEQLQAKSEKYEHITESSFNEVQGFLDVKFENGVYEIKFPDHQNAFYRLQRLVLGFGLILISVMVDLALYGPISDQFKSGNNLVGAILTIFPILMIIPLIFGLWIIDDQFTTDILRLSQNGLQYMTHNLVTKSTKARLPIEAIERLVVYKLGNSVGIEIVTENARIPVTENLTQIQAEKVKLAFENALYEFGKNK